MKKEKVCIIVALIVSSLLIALVGISYTNKEISLRNRSDAQIDKIEGLYDKTWKIIKQKASVTEEYKKTFEKVYPELISGRYSEGNELMKWIQEDNPDFDVSLYKDLMQSIETLRTEFQKNQEIELDIIREHKDLCNKFPGSIFLSGCSEIEYKVISSTTTKEVMDTGLENDVELWK